MKKLLFLIALAAYSQQTGYKLNPFTGLLDLAGNGYTAPSGYSATVTSQTTLTVTASAHGQGTAPTAWCFDNSSPALNVACSYTVSTIGDVVFSWSPAFTGTVLVRGTGANAGAAGDTVGPSSSTNTASVCFSGTSGKIIAGCSQLSTAGAIPYVTSSGVLGQDATNLFYDSTNKRLGVGTASPGAFLDVAASSATAGVRVSNGSLNQNPQMRVEGYATVKLQSLNTATDSRGAVGTESNNTLEFIVNNSGVARFATTGNLLIGGTTDGNYKLEVANSGTSGTARFYDATATTGSTKVVVRAGAGQSGNILEVQNNAGATLASIASTGYVATPQVYLTGDWLNLTSTTADMASGYVLRFSSTGAQSGTKDLGLARAAAGYLKVTDGSTGLGKIVVSQTTPAASTDACTAGALWADASYVYACTSSGVIKRATLATF